MAQHRILILAAIFAFLSTKCDAQVTINISTDLTQIGIGQSVFVTVQVTGAPNGTLVWPFCNESQWGANPPIGTSGSVSFALPIPIAGSASLQVVIASQEPPGPFFVGLPLSDFGQVTSSNVIAIDVQDRDIRRPNPDRGYYVAMEWEPWFTPSNWGWRLAEAIPVLGWYDSWNTMVMLQHAIWLSEAGVDALIVDWTNNLWNIPSWDQRPIGAQELINTTTATLEFYTYLRRNTSIPTPMVILLPGLDNGAVTPIAALNEEMEFVWEAYTNNESIDAGVWLQYEGQPLHIIFDGGNMHGSVPINNTHFTFRYMSSQFQANSLNKAGLWSWMDGSLAPLPTFYNNSVEALTVTPSFFSDGGWLSPSAYPRRGGTVFVEQFKTAAQYPPKFLIINQWNEFAGQANGASSYEDEYSTIYSDDIEPTNFQICPYERPNQKCGGWGFFYLNLMRALLDFHEIGASANFTIFTVGNPEPYDVINQTSLTVTWNWIGPDPQAIQILIDDEKIDQATPDQYSITIQFPNLAGGDHTVSVIAVNSQTYYPLSLNQVDVPSTTAFEPRIDVPIFLSL